MGKTKRSKSASPGIFGFLLAKASAPNSGIPKPAEGQSLMSGRAAKPLPSTPVVTGITVAPASAETPKIISESKMASGRARKADREEPSVTPEPKLPSVAADLPRKNANPAKEGFNVMSQNPALPIIDRHSPASKNTSSAIKNPINVKGVIDSANRSSDAPAKSGERMPMFSALVQQGADKVASHKPPIAVGVNPPVVAPLEPLDLAQSVRLTVMDGRQELVVRLKPELLGRALIAVHQEGEALNLTFNLERPEARAAVEAQSERLKEALAAAGFHDVTIDVRADNPESDWAEFTPDEDAQDKSRQNQPERGGEQSTPESQTVFGPRDFGYNTFEIAA